MILEYCTGVIVGIFLLCYWSITGAIVGISRPDYQLILSYINTLGPDLGDNITSQM